MKLIPTLVTSLGLFQLSLFSSASAEVVPVRIRMIAAALSYFNNPDPNGGSLVTSNVGFDVVWNLRRFDDSLYDAYTTQKLAGRGSMTYTPASGGAGTSGNFTFHPDRNPYLEIADQSNGVVTLKIAGPHRNGNTGTDSLLDDRTPNLPFIARVPYTAPFLSGGTLLTSSSSWTPAQQLLPNEADHATAEAQRAAYAIIRFSTKSLPQIVPFTYVYDANRDGTVSRNVFFGRVEISEDPPTVPLVPADALTLGGYTLPKAGEPPADPPSDLVPPDAADFSKWFTGLFPDLIKSIEGAIVKFHPSPSAGPLAFAKAKKPKPVTVLTQVSPGAPFGGKVRIALVLAPRGTTKTPAFPKKSTSTTIVSGTKSIKLVINPATLTALKSGKAYTVFILAEGTPEGGEATILSKRFPLKAKRK